MVREKLDKMKKEDVIEIDNFSELIEMDDSYKKMYKEYMQYEKEWKNWKRRKNGKTNWLGINYSSTNICWNIVCTICDL